MRTARPRSPGGPTRGPTRLRLAGAVLALSTVLTGPRALSAAPPASTPPTAPPRPALVEARSAAAEARARLDEVLRAQTELSARIDALQRGPGPADGALEAALTEGLALEREAEAAEAVLREATGALRAELRAAVDAVDGRMRALIPKLREGPLAERRAAARALKSLGAARERWAAERRALAPAPGGRWSLDVRPEPLDGPDELREKADYLEDARDKLRAKRRELVALLKRSRRTRRVQAAARSLETDLRLFDEETRPGRILRGAGGDEAAGAGPDAALGRGESEDGAPPASPGQGPSDPTPTEPGPAPNASFDGGRLGTAFGRDAIDTGGDGLGAAVPGEAGGPGEPGSSGGASAPPRPTVSRDLGALLGVEAAGVNPAEVDPEAMADWLERLAAAERRLGEEAEALRVRASALDSPTP